MPKLKPGTVLPTVAEDAAIIKAAMSDPDAAPFTDEQWEAARPKRGRPPAVSTKQQITLRVDRDTLELMRDSGPGWQTRAASTLSRWIRRSAQSRS